MMSPLPTKIAAVARAGVELTCNSPDSAEEEASSCMAAVALPPHMATACT